MLHMLLRSDSLENEGEAPYDAWKSSCMLLVTGTSTPERTFTTARPKPC